MSRYRFLSVNTVECRKFAFKNMLGLLSLLVNYWIANAQIACYYFIDIIMLNIFLIGPLGRQVHVLQTSLILTLSVPCMIVIALSQQLSSACSARPECVKGSCWLTFNGRYMYAMLGFVGKGFFAWEIQIWNHYSNLLGSWNIGTGNERLSKYILRKKLMQSF